MAVLGDKQVCGNVAWDNDLPPRIKQCKNNILGTGLLNHYGSNGGYYSYGNSSIY